MVLCEKNAVKPHVQKLWYYVEKHCKNMVHVQKLWYCVRKKNYGFTWKTTIEAPWPKIHGIIVEKLKEAQMVENFYKYVNTSSACL